MRTVARLVVAAAVAVATLGIAAPAAHAAVDKPLVWVKSQNPAQSIVCGFDGIPGADQVTVTGNPGDSFTFVNLNCGTARVLVPSLVTGPGSIANGGRGTFTLGSTLGSALMFVNTSLGAFGVTVVVTDAPVTAPLLTVHDDLQQVGVPASGDCADVDPSVGHYIGAPVGGWSKSWAWWINDGKGGPVCTRELEELDTGEIVLVG